MRLFESSDFVLAAIAIQAGGALCRAAASGEAGREEKHY
jgi:hypothetical protein